MIRSASAADRSSGERFAGGRTRQMYDARRTWPGCRSPGLRSTCRPTLRADDRQGGQMTAGRGPAPSGARLLGDDYQHLLTWLHAAKLVHRDPEVVRVE